MCERSMCGLHGAQIHTISEFAPVVESRGAVVNYRRMLCVPTSIFYKTLRAVRTYLPGRRALFRR